LEQLEHLLGVEKGRVVLRPSDRGFTLIELMIGLAVMGILLAVAVPAFDRFLQNTKIRNAAELTITGLNLARAEALRRNTNVRFQLVSDLTASCSASGSSLSWVVSLSDPAGACNAAPSDTTAPRIVQKRSALEGTAGVVAAATGGSGVVYTGLGRVSSGGLTQIDLSTMQGTCEHLDANGNRRCLRILISTGGQARMCDPKVADNTDPRFCI
jgi:type IV fimbrial biogenesis protein FimT